MIVVPPKTAGDVDLAARIARARALANTALLAERNASGTWTGELSASALSTATAVTALTLVARSEPAAARRLEPLIAGGYRWLVAHQNEDGGWGDTTKSFSNISTTALVWAALGLSADTSATVGSGRGDEAEAGRPACIAAAERWLIRASGSLEPASIVRAIEGRYGDDKTFSIPILTMCALCGRLGEGADAWRRVRQLPFEVAALPQRWFGALRLPVVSYALPALIAIGQVRHAMLPSANPFARAVRDRCRAGTLDKLIRLQPENGGFLEATPLTSFVTMSLAAMGLHEHLVVQRGVAFLEASVRSDGSWPIDTNLATWVTTLAVNALVPVAASASERNGVHSHTLAATDKKIIREALLRAQYQTEHPYTLAAPGGWAWTDLPGGVPDADDTAGALLALHRLADRDPGARSAAAAGVTWLLDLQNRDGGIPTFCRGWGRLPFDRSSPDLTAHAIRAWLVWRPELPATLQRRVDAALVRAAQFLTTTQRSDGAWVPLWFGHQEEANDENPLYGTARVVPALCELQRANVADVRSAAALARATAWLVSRQNADGGWSGALGAASSVEETSLALEALAGARELRVVIPDPEALRAALARGAEWLVAAVEREAWREPAPIGFYFAKLWYFERLYPLIFAAGALDRLARL